MVTSNWLILELSDFLDDISYKDIEAAILDVFGDDVEYFIPMYYEEIGSYISTSTLMEGYAFIKDCESVREKIGNIKDNKVFSKALFKKDDYITINSRKIAGLKHKLTNSLKKKFTPKDQVKVLDGVFKKLIGEVISIEDGGKNIMIKIKRVSREIIAPVPATLLEKIK